MVVKGRNKKQMIESLLMDDDIDGYSKVDQYNHKIVMSCAGSYKNIIEQIEK